MKPCSNTSLKGLQQNPTKKPPKNSKTTDNHHLAFP